MSDEQDELVSMSMYEMSRMLHRHDKDLYRGNGKPGITVRLNSLESYRERSEADLYDRNSGIVPEMTKFFAAYDEREKQAHKTTTKATLIIGLLALSAPILWDILKHFAWGAK